MPTIAETLEQRGYNRALHLVETAERRAEDEKRRAEDEKRRAELAERRAEDEKRRARRAERKKALRTAISMKRKALDMPLIASITELDEIFLEKLFRRIGV